MIKKTFVCVACGFEYPAKDLSGVSLSESGKDTNERAIKVVESPICVYCEYEDDLEDENAITDGVFEGRSDIERFELDGVYLDEGRLTSYLLNN